MPPMQIVPDGHCARHRPKNASRTRTATNKQTNSSSALALDATARPADSESLALATASMGESMKSKSSPFSTKTGRQCSSSRDVTSATERENDGQTPPAPQRNKRKHQEGNKKKNKTVPNRCKSKEAHVDKENAGINKRRVAAASSHDGGWDVTDSPASPSLKGRPQRLVKKHQKGSRPPAAARREKSALEERLTRDDGAEDDRYEVTAPPGALGMVIRTLYRATPFVHKLKAESVLAKHVGVGDLLFSVDGEDVTGMTATEVSQLISLKSDRPRLLVFGRRPGSKMKALRAEHGAPLDADEDDVEHHPPIESGGFDNDTDDEGMEVDVENDDLTAVSVKSLMNETKRLNAVVLSTMTQWSNGVNCDNCAKGGTRGEPIRLIVDGALAMGGLGGANDQDETVRPSWISSALLREVCPNATLTEYQLVGLNWLALLHGLQCDLGCGKQSNVNGILADEMGLGKTVQTIAFLSYLKYLSSQDSSSQRLPHLVIVPASVLSNWEREFQTFAPGLNVVKFYGSVEERGAMRRCIRNGLEQSSESDSRVDVILAPVTYFQKKKAKERKFLTRYSYGYLVVDEAHVLKNAKSNRFKKLSRIASSHRLLLTGTPVQNSPLELLTLLSFLMPTLFARAPFHMDDGAAALLRHLVPDGQNAALKAAAYGKLKELLAAFVLRRKKVNVLHQIVPPKTRVVEYVELQPSARLVYDSITEEHLKRKKSGIRSSGHLFTQLRKASHHPLLLRTRYLTQAEKEHLSRCFQQYGYIRGDGCTRDRVNEELRKMGDFEIHLAALQLLKENPVAGANDLQRYILSEEELFASAKFQLLRALLPDLVAKGHRILIFSVWTTCLDLLSCLMDSLDLAYRRMEGTTPVDERQALMDEFNNSDAIPVFLLSTKACGLGINLTSADVCIMHDLDFNPFNDLQAEDRCHRIGQKRPVTVYKLVALSTVDEDIYRMQVRKFEMNAAILGEDADAAPEAASSTKFNKTKEARVVLQDAVNRYCMRSPTQPRAAPVDAMEESPASSNSPNEPLIADKRAMILSPMKMDVENDSWSEAEFSSTSDAAADDNSRPAMDDSSSSSSDDDDDDEFVLEGDCD